jgi:hypothetical protein
MDHLISPKLMPGVHCLSLRHKGMYVTAVPYPEEANFYDKCDGTWYWCVETQTGFGRTGHCRRPSVHGRARLLQTQAVAELAARGFIRWQARDLLVWRSLPVPVLSRSPYNVKRGFDL